MPARSRSYRMHSLGEHTRLWGSVTAIYLRMYIPSLKFLIASLPATYPNGSLLYYSALWLAGFFLYNSFLLTFFLCPFFYDRIPLDVTDKTSYVELAPSLAVNIVVFDNGKVGFEVLESFGTVIVGNEMFAESSPCIADGVVKFEVGEGDRPGYTLDG